MTLQNKILTYVITLFIQILLLSNQVSANTGFNPTCTRVPLYPTGPSNIDRSNGGAACPIGNVNCDDYGDCGSIGTTDPSSVCYTDSCSDICTDFVVDTNTTISSNLTCDSVTIKNGATLTLDATLTINGNAIIENGGIITHTAGASSNFNLNIGGTLNIQAGGKIDTSGRGISTLGTGPSGAGASHGGYGASASSKIPYGDTYNPITIGSHGYSTGFPGGGLVRITVGTLINNGSILANGANNNGGRSLGSGGGININVNGNVSGTGVYQAMGGAFYGNSGVNGGGGRIAIKYGSVDSLDNLKTKVSATGPYDGGEGTIYLKNLSTGYDYLYIKGDGRSGMGNIFLSGATTFSEVIVENSVLRQYIPTNISNLTIGNGGYLFLNEKMTVSGNAIVYNGGTITHDTVQVSLFNLQVGGTLEIHPGGKFDVSGRGISTLGTGPSGAGASHGGYGASASSKIPYGDTYNPITVGSHGYSTGFPGGGLVRMTVGTLINNGSILANGANNNGGRSLGSGGGININVNGNVSGTGVYQAIGGAFYGNSGVNGGGGRIAIKYGSISDLDLLKTKVSATGPYDGGEGTIYISNNTSGYDYLYIKGDGRSGMGNIFLSGATSFSEVIVENSVLRQYIPTNITNLKIGNGGYLFLNEKMTASGNAIIYNGGTITHDVGATSNFDLDIGGSLDINPGGKIDTTGKGASATGAGTTGVGGSHGGYGAHGSSKIPYGDTYNPTTVGSYGSPGYYGGGLIKIKVGTLVNNGTISSNGLNSNSGYGLGSGGSINIIISGDVSGTGVYQAVGGAYPGYYGSNGGGGRIAIKYGSVDSLDNLKSKVTAIGPYDGGDGTIYLKDSSSGYDYLYIKGDTSSTIGTVFLTGATTFSEVVVENSVLRQNIPTNITTLKINNLGYLVLNAKMTVSGDAIVYNGGTITHDVGATSNFDLDIGGSLDIQVGGKIDVSGKGAAANGAGTTGVGGSHGGYGAHRTSKIPYGDAYNPTTVGSYGTSGYYGGGLIKIRVGNLINNGTISSNGLNSNSGYGLGAGGSINIIINGDASGTGVYQAIGGSYPGYYGSNGGGGRIAISYTNTGNLDLFKTKASAIGPYDAGDGTIYLKNLSSGYDYLYVKGDTTSTMGTVFLTGATTFSEVIVENSILRQTIPTDITNLKINNLGYLVLDDKMTVSGDANIYNGGTITHSTGTGSNFDLHILGNLEINPGGKIDTSGKGISALAIGSNGVGASHGGYGAHGASKIPYGDTYNPTTVGSYGTSTSNPGGGLIKMTVNNIINNGTIASNGINNNGGYGLGSGGSINIVINGDASGTGVYQALGGSYPGNYGSNGGGGRIAIRYKNSENLDLLKDRSSAMGPYDAGEGTIYLKNLTTGYDYLYIKGNGRSEMGNIFLENATTFSEVIVENAVLKQSIPTNITNLKINNGGYLILNEKMTVSGDAHIYNGGSIMHSIVQVSLFNLIIGGTLEVHPGGKIDTNGRGASTAATGSNGVGASHGGYGASRSSKTPYGDTYNPITVGSYGTSGYYGGGLVRMTVGNIINNGTISSNGYSNNGGYGLGSGGSINIIINGDASGTGVYQALGGSYPGNYGSNGGGGRIAIRYTNPGNLDLLKAQTNASGPYDAGEGTIYLLDLSSGYDYLYIKGNGRSEMGNIILENATVFGEIIVENAVLKQGLQTDIKNLKINNGGYLLLNEKMNVSGDAHIYNGGYITHSPVAVSLFNLQVGGTVEVHPGGRIDTNGKGISSLAYGANGMGASHGGYGANGSSRAPYGDVYNPTTVGSYGTSTSYPGGGLIRMTAGTLINNGTICSNGYGNNGGYGLGSGGSINIIINGETSGTGVYQAVGGAYPGYYGSNGGGGRIAIRYKNSDNLELLKTNSNASGPYDAGEGTIYLKDLTTGNDYLYVKGYGYSGRNTSVGTGYPDYYFDVIEVRDGSRLYKIGSEDIVSSSCITAGSPLGVIDTNINCSGQADFRYYDLSVSLKNYDLTKRKYEFLIDGPEGGANFVEAFTGVISGNGIIPTRIKITKLGTYNFKFNIYDGDLECSEIDKSASKSVQVKSN